MKKKGRIAVQSRAQRVAAGKAPYRLVQGEAPHRMVQGKNRKLTTAVTFTASELSALGDYMAAGMVMLRITTPHKAVGKFKAAMSRLKVPAPRGL